MQIKFLQQVTKWMSTIIITSKQTLIETCIYYKGKYKLCKLKFCAKLRMDEYHNNNYKQENIKKSRIYYERSMHLPGKK
jgi:hypothetical protein